MTDISFDVDIPGVLLERIIGRGASSTVYLGTQVRFGRKVAVKVLDRTVKGVDQLAAFQTECQTLGRLAPHPDIVTVFDADVLPNGNAYLVLDYLAGGPLSDRLARDGAFPPADVCRIGVRLAGALESAHRADVVHGDVKPQNVLWTRVGDPALVDFGVAQFMSDAASGPTSLTPSHAAPEVRNGGGPTPASDVYGLASTLHELVTGAPPEVEEVTGAVDLGRLVALGHPVGEVIAAGLSTDPSNRPSSAAEFGDLLREAQAAEGVDPTPMVVIEPADDEPPMPVYESVSAPTMPPLPPPGRRRGPALVLAAVAVLAAAVAVTAAVLNDNDKNTAAPTSSTSVKVQTTGPSAPGKPGTNDRVAGLQPDVNYEVPGVTATDRVLASVLADNAIYTSAIPDSLVFDYPQDVQKYPARVNYQFYNSDTKSSCPGFYASGGVLRGGLIKGIKWGAAQENLGIVIVQQFKNSASARTAVAGLSMSLGPNGTACASLPTESQAEVVATSPGPDFRVQMEEPPLPDVSSKVADYTSAQGANQDPRWVFGAKAVARSGPYVVGIATNTTSATGQVPSATISALLNSVVDQLPPAGK
jgi:serine/threonine protein kinase